MAALFDLSGRAALVTGASRGLGFEIAAGLARHGAAVWLNGRDPARLDAGVARLRGENLHAAAAAFDVADATGLRAGVAAVLAEAGRLDVVVANVGQRDRRRLDEMPLEAFEALLRVDLTAAFALVKETLPALRASGDGRIIFVTSVAGALARSGDAAYTTAKGGLAALMRALAVELGREGVTANAIAPGYFATEANAEWTADEGVSAYVARRVPMARWGRPPEIAGAAVFLASPAATYVNGHVLHVDGGFAVSY